MTTPARTALRTDPLPYLNLDVEELGLAVLAGHTDPLPAGPDHLRTAANALALAIEHQNYAEELVSGEDAAVDLHKSYTQERAAQAALAHAIAAVGAGVRFCLSADDGDGDDLAALLRLETFTDSGWVETDHVTVYLDQLPAGLGAARHPRWLFLHDVDLLALDEELGYRLVGLLEEAAEDVA